MKNVLAIFVLTAFAVVAYAEPVSKSLSTDVVDVTCMPGSAVCDITLSDGRVMNEEQGALVNYLSVVPGIKGAGEDEMFIYNSANEIISLNPKAFGKGGVIEQQKKVEQPVQQASTPPYELDTSVANMGSDAYPIPVTRLRFISKVNGLKISKMTMNEGSNKCPQFDEKTTYNGEARSKLNMGDALEVTMASNCNFIKMVVETNMGSWTHGGR